MASAAGQQSEDGNEGAEADDLKTPGLRSGGVPQCYELPSVFNIDHDGTGLAAPDRNALAVDRGPPSGKVKDPKPDGGRAVGDHPHDQEVGSIVEDLEIG